MAQVSDSQEIEEITLNVIHNHPDEVKKYIGGREKLFGFFIGQVMKATQGKADPKLVNEIMHEKLTGLKKEN